MPSTKAMVETANYPGGLVYLGVFFSEAPQTSFLYIRRAVGAHEYTSTVAGGYQPGRVHLDWAGVPYIGLFEIDPKATIAEERRGLVADRSMMTLPDNTNSQDPS